MLVHNMMVLGLSVTLYEAAIVHNHTASVMHVMYLDAQTLVHICTTLSRALCTSLPSVQRRWPRRCAVDNSSRPDRSRLLHVKLIVGYMLQIGTDIVFIYSTIPSACTAG